MQPCLAFARPWVQSLALQKKKIFMRKWEKLGNDFLDVKQKKIINYIIM
jgi:hypothetical protein